MNQRDLALHVLETIATAQFSGLTLTLDTVAHAVRARRADVRRAVSALHQEGFVDALRMRPTLSGLALGRALAGVKLPELRAVKSGTTRAA